MSNRLIYIAILLLLTSTPFAQVKTVNQKDGVYGLEYKDTVNGKIISSDFLPFVYFQKNQSVLESNFKDSLNFLYDYLKGTVFKISVQGFCRADETKSLAQLRAKNVFDYLVSIGVPDSMLLVKDMQQNQNLWTSMRVVNHGKEYYISKTTTFSEDYIMTLDKEKREAAKMLLQLVTLSFTKEK